MDFADLHIFIFTPSFKLESVNIQEQQTIHKEVNTISWKSIPFSSSVYTQKISSSSSASDFIWEVLHLDLGWGTNSPYRVSSWFSSVLPGKHQDSTLNCAMAPSFYFQFIIPIVQLSGFIYSDLLAGLTKLQTISLKNKQPGTKKKLISIQI